LPEKIDKNIAIVGLILNIVILPGLGTLIGGGEKYRTSGIWQLVLTIIGIPLIYLFIGAPLILAMWIWALITGIHMVQEGK